MKILLISDHEEKQLYDFFDAGRWTERVDLVISCGDLHRDYLSYLVTVMRVPLLYVAGNHDTRFRTEPPEGCDDIDGKLVRFGGLRIGGINGTLKYNADSEHYQFSEWEMRGKVRRLSRAVRRARGVDLVVTHAAPHRCPFIPGRCARPAGLGRDCIHPEIEGHPSPCPEAIDACHRAVPAYDLAIRRWQPRWWVHGHNHIEYGRVPRLWWIGTTQVLNADGHILLDTEHAGDREAGSVIASR